MKSRLLVLFLLLSLSFLFIGCINVEESDVTIVIKPGIDTVEVNSEYVDNGATAKANNWTIAYDIVENDVDITSVGVYQILYETTYRGFTKQALRVVTVVDETPPVVTLKSGLDTIYEGDTWVDAGIETSDNSLLPVETETEGVVSADYAGEYHIKYIVTDQAGNQTEIVRYVNVLRKP